MAYSNGFDLTQVLTKLFGRIGWAQASGVPTLSANNLLASSGRKFNDGSFHALVTLKNIKDVMEQTNPSDSEFNAYLEQLQKSIIIRSLTGVFSEKEYIQQTLLYKSFGGLTTALENTGKFVGVKFNLPSRPDVAVQIDSIGLLFDSDVTFNLYLFNENVLEPIEVLEVDAEANTETIVDIEDLILKHISNSNLGGAFYLGYFQSEIGSAKAVRVENAQPVCNTIFGYSFISSEAAGQTFDREQVSYSSQTNGLNPSISVFRDHTQSILKNAALFDNLIGLQMSAQVIEQVLFSTRSNQGERALKDGVDKAMGMLVLEGIAPVSDSPQTTGIKKQITQELNRVKKSFYPKPKSMNVSLC